MHTPSVATLREGQRCRATGGRNPMDWVATFLWIEWELCRGLGGNFLADWVAEFRGIRTQESSQHITMDIRARAVAPLTFFLLAIGSVGAEEAQFLEHM